MPVRGVHYDVGQHYAVAGRRDPASTRPYLDPARVQAEMIMIADDLHANAVRIAGTDLGRVATAATAALRAGLTAWLSPHPADLDEDETVAYLAEAAGLAETLRTHGGSVGLVAGCELSLFGAGYVPGATADDRLATLVNGAEDPAALQASLAALPEALNATLGRSASAVRGRFRGPVTYASAPWEPVDWAPFDLVGVDLYRDAANADGYPDLLRGYTHADKQVVITEFGCCTYRGAADAGGAGFMIVDEDEAHPGSLRLSAPGLQRSEAEQARYLTELLGLFDEVGVHGAFWHTFAGWAFPHRPDPSSDLDLASFGLVKIVDTGSEDGGYALEPKEAFAAMAAAYRAHL